MKTSQQNLNEINSYNHTFHSSVRANQRGISDMDISFVICNSKPVYKQKLCFYSLKNPTYFTPKFPSDHIIDLIVVTDDNSASILTVYKSENGLKKIKHKCKRLSKNKYCA